jgi:hypothetical protein
MPKAIAFWAFWSDEVFLPAALLTCRSPHNAQILAKKSRDHFWWSLRRSSLIMRFNAQKVLEAHCCASVEIPTLPVKVVLKTI